MSNEITLYSSLFYSDADGTTDLLQVLGKLVSPATLKITRVKQLIGTSEEALQLGEVTSLGYVIIVNRDSANFVELRVATAGTKFAKLKAGEVAMFRFGSGITAPFAIADTSACLIDMLLCSA